ncbi:hypothetical protein [Actinomadura sp. WMMA1423]|uniref:hypothetical protein n=1 Tax=Actinomadura sp. WMMA1423 TaxID=2591108 RepID=UPI001146AD1C|nr:hypothetical protein [Actinomadura sp. WMMA1423]
MTGARDIVDALAPVRGALADRARTEAARLVADAERDAAATTGGARAEAARILAEAQAAGRADGALAAAVARSRARAASRAIVLRARRQAYDELRRRIRREVRALFDGPDAPANERALTARARGLLGTGALIGRAGGGGLVARVPDAEVDLSADALTDRAMAALGTEVAELWAPR